MKRIKNLLYIFGAFSIMGIQMLGNLVTMIPIFENELVKKRKLITSEEVLDSITIGRCGPGAAIINTVAFIGNELDGFLGGIFATIGFCFFPFIIILVISYTIDSLLNNEITQNFLTGVSACICVMITYSMIDFWNKTIKSNICLIVFLITLILAISTNIPIVFFIIVWGIYGIAIKENNA